MNTTLPIEFRMWDAWQCGDYFGCTREHFLRTLRHSEGFPMPLLVLKGKRPRWAAKAVIEWALK